MGPKPWLILPVLRAGPDRRTDIVSEVEMIRITIIDPSSIHDRHVSYGFGVERSGAVAIGARDSQLGQLRGMYVMTYSVLKLFWLYRAEKRNALWGYDLSVTAYGALVRHALRRYVVVAWICGYCTGSQLLVHVSSSLCLELSLELCGLLW
ncbi:hypothetical protein F2Q70_00004816 [Brassica cretica]|uniref:Uncharacterized protein n=1 Tax=Brassica cretica TaxID=69181 RepID=A0A8S9IQF9_BRACR|nr:hypothetical protein F2Q70_00004816 [Brassica cretica]